MLQELDVLVTIHGAQVANGMLMKQGASVIEVRQSGWWSTAQQLDEDGDSVAVLGDLEHWSNIYPRLFWRDNHTFYWHAHRSNSRAAARRLSPHLTSSGPFSAGGTGLPRRQPTRRPDTMLAPCPF